MKKIIIALGCLCGVLIVFVGYRPIRAYLAYQAVRQAIVNNLSCQQDSDCVTIGSGACETGCYMTFNRSAQMSIESLVSSASNYRDTSCRLDCPAPPTPKCVQNICQE